jgi:hypothetical protein
VLPQPIVIVSLALQIVAAFASWFIPSPQPKLISELLTTSTLAGAIFMTAHDLPLTNVVFKLNLFTAAAILLVWAAIPPLAGLIETRISRRHHLGNNEESPYSHKRFTHHLVANLVLASFSLALLRVSQAIAAHDKATAHWLIDTAAIDVALPLATLITLAWVRWEQVNECPDLDERVEQHKEYERQIYGFSLKRAHQFLNVTFLSTTLFVALTTGLYILANIIDLLASELAGAPEAGTSVSLIAVTSAVVGILVTGIAFPFAAKLKFYSQSRRDSNGRLDIDPVIIAVESCHPGRFTRGEVLNRRKAIKQIGKIAATIESIPFALKFKQSEVVAGAAERAAAVRQLQSYVTRMTDDEKAQIIEILRDIKRLHDDGRWWDLPAVDEAAKRGLSLAKRISFVLVVVICVAGIISVVALCWMDHTAVATVAPLTFVLGALLYGALAGLGFPGTMISHALDAASKVEKGV